MKATFELTGLQFKKQYIQLLAQQLPLADVDSLQTSAITIKYVNTTIADTDKITIIVNNIPETEPESD